MDTASPDPDTARGRARPPAPPEWTPPPPRAAVSLVDLPPGWRPLAEPTLLLQDFPADATRETLLHAFQYCQASSVDFPPKDAQDARVHFPTLDLAELALATLGGPGSVRVAPPPGGVGRPKAGSDPAEWVTACTRIVYPLPPGFDDKAALWGLVRPAGPIRRLDIRKVHARMALPPLPEEKEITTRSDQPERKKAALVQFHAPAAAERLKDMVARWAQEHRQIIETYRYEQWTELQPQRRSSSRPSPRLGPSLIIDTSSNNAVPSTPLLAPTPLLGPREQPHQPVVQKPPLDTLDEDVPTISIETSLHKGKNLMTAVKSVTTASPPPATDKSLATPSKEPKAPVAVVPELVTPAPPTAPRRAEPLSSENPTDADKPDQAGSSSPHVGLLLTPMVVPTPVVIPATPEVQTKEVSDLPPSPAPHPVLKAVTPPPTPAVLPASSVTEPAPKVGGGKMAEVAKISESNGAKAVPAGQPRIAKPEAVEAKAAEAKAAEAQRDPGAGANARLQPGTATPTKTSTEPAQPRPLKLEHIEALPLTVQEEMIVALLEKSVRAHLRQSVPAGSVAVGAAKVMATAMEDQAESIVRSVRPTLGGDVLLKALTDPEYLATVTRAHSVPDEPVVTTGKAAGDKDQDQDVQGPDKSANRVSATERKLLLTKVKAAFPSGSAAQCSAAVGALIQLPKQERRLVLLSRQRLHQTLTKIEARTPWAFGSPPDKSSAQSRPPATLGADKPAHTPTAPVAAGTETSVRANGADTAMESSAAPAGAEAPAPAEDTAARASASAGAAAHGEDDATTAAASAASPSAGEPEEQDVRYLRQSGHYDSDWGRGMAGSALARRPALEVEAMVEAHLQDLARGGTGIRAPFENESLWLAGLERYSVPDQKQAVGDRLFPLVKAALGPGRGRAGARRVSAYRSRCRWPPGGRADPNHLHQPWSYWTTRTHCRWRTCS